MAPTHFDVDAQIYVIGHGPQMAKRTSDEEERAAERHRRALTRFMERHELNPADWAKAAGLPSANAIYNFLSGDSRSLAVRTLEKLAAVVPNATISDLVSEVTPPKDNQYVTAYIRGHVQAGAWREGSEWPREDWKPIVLPKASLHRSTKSYFLEIRGDSMDELYPDGTIVEVVDLPVYEKELKSGNKVICERVNKFGLTETTCKQILLKDNKLYLLPRSKNPAHDKIALPWPPEDGETPRQDGIEQIRIKAVVIRAITQED